MNATKKRRETRATAAPRAATGRRRKGPPVRDKVRITIWLDEPVIDHFKSLAGERGYQTLINEALRRTVDREVLEDALRRVIRDEVTRARNGR